MKPKNVVDIPVPETVAEAEVSAVETEVSAAAPAAEAVLTLEEQLAAKEKEARENWDRFLRERADLENYRKRAAARRKSLLNYGTKSLIEEILPVIDNLERALGTCIGRWSGCRCRRYPHDPWHAVDGTEEVQCHPD